MTLYVGRIALRDEHGLISSKEYNIDVSDVTYVTPDANFAAAYDAIRDVAAALDNIIDAVVTAVTIAVDVTAGVSGLKGTPGDQGVAEGALLRLFITSLKLFAMFIPSAKAGVFLSDFATVDTADAEMIAYMQSLAPGGGVTFTFSDGEEIDAGLGADGLKDGRYATKSRTVKP